MRDEIVLADDVPRKFDAAGRLIIPLSGRQLDGTFIGADTLLRPIIDVLLKNVDLSEGNGPYTLTPVAPYVHQNQRYAYRLPVPVDLTWLLAHCLISSDIKIATRQRTATPAITNGWNFIYSEQRGDSRRWARAGWREGEPYDGARPAPRANWWER